MSESSSPARMLTLGCLAVSAMATCGVGGLLFFGLSASPVTPPPAPPTVSAPVPAPSIAVPPPPVAPTPTFRAMAEMPLWMTDVDGDAHPDLVMPIEAREGGRHYAVFDARTGAERARTPALEGLEGAIAAIAGTSTRRLVVASGTRGLRGFDLRTGTLEWTSTLAPVASLCNSRSGVAVLVTLEDGRRSMVDLATGAESPTRETCEAPIARGTIYDDLRDRHDYSAPEGIEAFHCGEQHSIDDDTFAVPDPCQPRIRVDVDRLDGMIEERIWRHGTGWLVLGHRSENGRWTPRAGLLEGDHFAWSGDVVATRPLDVVPRSEVRFALVGETLIATFSTESDRGSWMTGRSVTDGALRFTVPLAIGVSPTALVGAEDVAVVRVGGSARVVGVADGATRIELGSL